MTYFKNVKSYDDLKKQFKALLKANHPDNGGDPEIMKAINVEYDALFPIWKNRKEATTGATVNETADSTRRQFYTEFGWEGSNHDWSRSLKEVAQIVRAYVKEKYPTYKFGVRTSYASMCQELHVDLKESPVEIYKNFEDLTSADKQELARRLYPWDWQINDKLHFLNAADAEKKAIIEGADTSYAHIINETTKAVVDDVDAFVKSYNFEDCDGQIDYFDVDFYYFGCCQNNGKGVKIVPKTAKAKKSSQKPAEPKQEAPEAIEEKTGYTYKITKGEDTRDGSDLWIVRIVESLDKAAYIAENKRMKERGAYYSKFLHGFLFRVDPSDLLKIA